MTPIRPQLSAAILGLALAGCFAAASARADDPAPATDRAPADSSADAAPAPDGLEHLVPALARNPYRLEPGVRPYLHRLSISPGFGALGSERLFVLRVADNPNSWLCYD